MEKNYAAQEGKFQEGYFKQYQGRDEDETTQASYRYRPERSWEIKEETIKDIIRQNYPGLL
jgi:hypothetical protein